MIHALAFVAAILGSPQDDALKQKVDSLIAQLASDAFDDRENASQALIHLGSQIESLIRARLAGIKDPEVEGRLAAVLQWFAVGREEEFALGVMKEGRGFPPYDKHPLRIEGGTAEQNLEAVRKSYGLKIELYANDAWLDRLIRETVFPGTIHSSDAEQILGAIVFTTMEAAYVVDKDRIVIVRLTPPVLLARLAQEPRRSFLEIESRLRRFATEQSEFSMTMGSFLAGCAEAQGPRRTKWLNVLSTAIQDPARSTAFRCAAMAGLGQFYGAVETLQPDSTAVVLKAYRGKETPAELRVEAANVLTLCMEPEAVAAVLDALEKGGAPLQKELLAQLASIHYFGLSGLVRIVQDPVANARLLDALQDLEAAKDPDLALRATALLVLLERPDAAGRLAKAALTRDRMTTHLVLEGLRFAAWKKDPAAPDRVDALAEDADPMIRAGAACIFGNSAGGRNRERDLRGARKLLGDREPLVRWAAANAIGTIFSTSAAEPYVDGWEDCRTLMKQQLNREEHPKVKIALGKALEEGPK